MPKETSEEILTFACKVITPLRQVYSADKVVNAKFAATTGDLELQPRHEPLLSPLAVGYLYLTELQPGGETTEKVLNVNGGFLDLNGELATVFAYSAETAEEIDLERAKAAHTRAQERLDEVKRQGPSADKLDEARAERALYRAISRIKLCDLR